MKQYSSFQCFIKSQLILNGILRIVSQHTTEHGGNSNDNASAAQPIISEHMGGTNFLGALAIARCTGGDRWRQAAEYTSQFRVMALFVPCCLRLRMKRIHENYKTMREASQ